jgi:hypothetical protein
LPRDAAASGVTLLTAAALASPPVLYHYLNHFNLFGSGYYSQCRSIMEGLVPKVLVS